MKKIDIPDLMRTKCEQQLVDVLQMIVNLPAYATAMDARKIAAQALGGTLPSEPACCGCAEIKAFIDNHVTPNRTATQTLDQMHLKHNDVWALRQLVDAAAQREAQLEAAIEALLKYATFAEPLSPEMEAVVAKHRGALAGNPHKPGTLAFDVWQRGYMGLSFSGHAESVAAGWHTAGAEAKYQQQISRGTKA